MYCFSCYLALKLESYLYYSIDISKEQSFRYVELVDAKIWICKNVLLCQVCKNQITHTYTHACTHIYMYCMYVCTNNTYEANPTAGLTSNVITVLKTKRYSH